MSVHRAWSLAELKPLVPDVREPLDVPCSSSLTLAQRQRQRRAQILCVARSQIDEGSTMVNVRDLSDRCDLCIQTIYNLVGSKTEILTAAVDEHYSKILSSIDASSSGAAAFDLLADILWLNARQNPSYIQCLIQRYFENSDAVQAVIRKRIRHAFSTCMQRYLAEQGRRSAVSSELLEKMHALVAISSFEWAHGRAGIEELRSRLSGDFDLVLRSARAA